MTKDEGALRPATEEDVEELVALWAHYLRAHHHNPAYKRIARTGLVTRRSVFARHIRDADAQVFVIERPDGGLDGMVTCFTQSNQPYFLPPRYGRIQSPYVRPWARKKGYLKRLLHAAYRWAREQELTEVRLYTGADNVLANAIAEELGFEAIEIVRRKPIDWSMPPEEPSDDRD